MGRRSEGLALTGKAFFFESSNIYVSLVVLKQDIRTVIYVAAFGPPAGRRSSQFVARSSHFEAVVDLREVIVSIEVACRARRCIK